MPHFAISQIYFSLYLANLVMLSLDIIHATSFPSRNILLFDSVQLFILSFDILQRPRAGNRIFVSEDEQAGIRSEVCV